MRVKLKAVVGISQSFQTSDVIARYTGVINRQIKTHQKGHGCLKRLRQIIEGTDFCPTPFNGATFVLASGILLVLHTCAMYWIYVMSHLYGQH